MVDSAETSQEIESALQTAAAEGQAGEAAHEEGSIHIALAAEQLGTFAGLPITNTLLTSWVVFLILSILALTVGRKIALIPNRLQTLLEMAFEGVYDYVAETLESRELARRFFPLLMTIFLFVFIANAIEFTPGIGSLGFFHENGEFSPLFRSVNTDLNMTLALTLITMFVIEAAGVFALGLFRYGSKFLNFSSPINFIVGLIELVSEAGRLVSFSFRLFGNVFAGEVLIAVVMFFMPYALPVPLMAFEMFVGFIQAAVFSLLALFFIKMAITDPHGAEAH